MLVWLTFFLLPYLINPDYDPRPFALRLPPGPPRSSSLRLTAVNTLIKFFWLGLFYFNAFFLVPRLVYKRKYLLYVLSLMAIFGSIMFVHGLLFHLVLERRLPIRGTVTYNFVSFALTVILSSAFKSITDQIRTERMLAEKQNENLKTELSFLRSQISPHFLFNVMNNIVALVRMKSDDLEPTVMKLSGLMQYMLYESDEEKVLLKSEVEYLRSYIDLQKQRFGPELKLETTFDVKEDWHAIEPMLLIPFVENAFKHGSSASQAPEIKVFLSVMENKLHFMVTNTFQERAGPKDKTSGIGLMNVKRRLELLYPATHKLVIDSNKNLFIIDLQVTLS